MQTDSSPELLLHSAGVVLALSAAIVALYLIPLARGVVAWVSMSVAFVLLAAERILDMAVHRGLVMDNPTWETVSDELHLGILSCLLLGAILIRRLFVEREDSNRRMLESIDELQRFRDATIGRELRMKELYEENQQLKARQFTVVTGGDLLG